MEKAQVTQKGIFDMQVCVPKDWPDWQIIKFAGIENPSGTSGWFIRKEGDKALAGDPEKQPCLKRNGFVHVMLDA